MTNNMSTSSGRAPAWQWFGQFMVPTPGPPVFRAVPAVPSAALLSARKDDAPIKTRFGFEATLLHANEQGKTLMPNPAVDCLIKEKALPPDLADWELFVRTGTLVAYGPSDGRHIVVPVPGADGQFYLIPHPPEYAKTGERFKHRQLVFATHGFEEDLNPFFQIHHDGNYRVMKFSREEHLHHLIVPAFDNDARSYLDGSPSGIPTLDSGTEWRTVVRQKEGESFVGFIARYTHSNNRPEYVVHMALPPDAPAPALVYDCEVPAVESFVSLDY